HVGVAAEMPWWFSVKIMRKEGEGRGSEIQGRKRQSPFSTLKSCPHSFLFFLSYDRIQLPFLHFHVRTCG
ncbi:hypothetical protein, partial [Aneurinibacillus sp. UBA3580]|uniref:hypothetical protein n=1 Tax=Aneurinibacillus sp. UBA3580 TaxID=1946041 RepID=UPI00257E16A1